MLSRVARPDGDPDSTHCHPPKRRHEYSHALRRDKWALDHGKLSAMVQVSNETLVKRSFIEQLRV
jgi:hypothetical protein